MTGRTCDSASVKHSQEKANEKRGQKRKVENPNARQRIRVVQEHNWDIRRLKGAQTFLKHLCYNMGMIRRADQLNEMCEYLIEKVKERRTAKLKELEKPHGNADMV